jgi:D-glycero-alpha-D-manno-heptose 1-phosphate guanylyltransferase
VTTTFPLLVLAGGFGTRLRSAVGDVPKPLAPVSDKPFLRFLLERWVEQGVREFVFLLYHGADVIAAYLEQERSHLLRGCAVRTVVESAPMGTGGAIANAVRELGMKGSFAVANADTWLGTGVNALGAANAPAVGVVHVADTSRYGAVRVDGDQIVAFEEKNAMARAGWINAGIYALNAADFASWNGGAFSIEAESFPRWAAAGRLGAVPLNTTFIDIGIPEDYQRFCRWAESGQSGSP